jgi:hypothetical protein
VEKVPGRSSGRWVFSIKGECISKEMFIAAGTEIDRDLWIIALRNSIASVPHVRQTRVMPGLGAFSFFCVAQY